MSWWAQLGWIAAAGAVGALLRWGAELAEAALRQRAPRASARTGSPRDAAPVVFRIPWGITVANLAGAVLILAAWRLLDGPALSAVSVGLCGCLTTFSSLMLAGWTLLRQRDAAALLLLLLVNFGAGTALALTAAALS